MLVLRFKTKDRKKKKKKCRHTPKHTERPEPLLVLNRHPRHCCDATANRTKPPGNNGPEIVRKHAHGEAANKTPRDSEYKHVQRSALVATEALAGIRGDVKVRDAVAKEGHEGAGSEHNEEGVTQSRGVDEGTAFTGLLEPAGAGEEGGNGDDGGEEGDEADAANGPREGEPVDEVVEHYDVNNSSYF
jgi:hypothetical protein